MWIKRGLNNLWLATSFYFFFTFYFPFIFRIERERKELAPDRSWRVLPVAASTLCPISRTLSLSLSLKSCFSFLFFHFPMYFIFSTLFNHFSLPLDRLSLPLFYSPSIKLIFIFSFSTFSYSLLRRFCDGLDFQSRDFIRVPRIWIHWKSEFTFFFFIFWRFPLHTYVD